MRRIWNWLPSFGSSLVLAANALAAPPAEPPTPPDGALVTTAAPADMADEREVRPLLERLSQLSQLIDRDNQSAQAWQYHLEQAEVLLQLAVHSRGKERANTLKMAVDGFYSSALLAPREQPLAFERLRQLPQRLGQAFPGNAIVEYAILQEIQADCMRVMEETGDNNKAQEHRCTRLLQFAQQHPGAPAAARAILEAAHIRESLNENAEAARCYRYLITHFPADAAVRKAEGALWRLGQNPGPVHLQLPFLYPTGSGSESTFNIDQLHGSLIVVYFWTSASPHAAEDFEALKHLTDRWAGRGLEVVYVNLDEDAAQGRAFLSGRLTAGVHVHQAGGLQSAIAERYGIQELPQAFLLARDGSLLKHSLPAARLESEVLANLPRGR